MTKKHLYFVRHGKTEWNDRYRFQGKSDIPLDEEGISQAERLAIRARGWKGSRILTSPLSRALRTAEILAASSCEVAPECRPGLAEMGFGRWEGLSIFEVEAANPQVFREWKKNPFEHTPPQGETFPEIRRRISAVLDEAISSEADRVVLVSHGGVIRAALSLLLGLGAEAVWKMKLSNCSVTCLESGKRGNHLAFLNDDLHLFASAEVLPNIPFSA